jgi:hypothetical protein
LSSTTKAERGQTLVIFALSLVVILSFAALAFDVGQVLLSKRAQQDTADAAALAGARYIADPACKASPSLSNPACRPAITAALVSAASNGYGDGGTNCAAVACGSNVNPQVSVKVPPGPEAGPYDGAAGTIEVQVRGVKGSIFAAVQGITDWNVGVLAVAANRIDFSPNYSILALSPNCPSVSISGSNSSLTVNGNIQVNATCAGGINVGNNGSIDVSSGSCNLSGPSPISTNHGSSVSCTLNYNQPVVPDPLAGLPPPTIPPVASPPVNLDVTTATPPSGCMSTLAAPVACSFPNNSTLRGTRWRLFPGTYPGGLSIQANATFYLQPGIYYIAGGGVQINGAGSGSSASTPIVMSVSDGTTTLGGGVLLYNTADVSGGTTILAAQSINLNGSQANINLLPYQTDPYAGIVIFQDRTVSVPLKLNGAATNLNVTGTMYLPAADVQVNGSSSNALTAQIIAYSFTLLGSAPSLDVGYNSDSFFHIRGSGLVQ